MSTATTRKPNDFKSDLKPIWCPGCGDFGVLASLYRAFAHLDLDPAKTVWQEISGYPHPPEACLVNYYASGTKMGLHQDADEADFSAPVVSISLGDTCLFRIGGMSRKDTTRSFRLSSGDVVVLGGVAHAAFPI